MTCQCRWWSILKNVRERKVESDSVGLAVSHDWSHVKLQVRSWPDHLFLGPEGKTFFVEFKKWGKLPTTKQAAKINACRDMGHRVYVVDNYPYFEGLFERERKRLK